MRKKVLIAGGAMIGLAAGVWAWQENLFRAKPAVDYEGPVAGWDTWGNDPGGARFSPLTQITPANVWALKPAWTYHVGLIKDLPKVSSPTLEATPIVAENRLYICGGGGRVAAVDPETGKEIWANDTPTDKAGAYLLNCRGVTYARDSQVPTGQLCAGRIFAGTVDYRLVAYDSATGRLCPSFGRNGMVDLKADMGRYERGDLSISSPPVVIGDNVVVNGRVADNHNGNMPAGVIRSFNLHTGAATWSWNALPPGMDGATNVPKDEKFVRSTPNSWGVMSADPALNLVYVPMGNAPPDHFAATRNGLDYYSSSVVALDGSTGQVRWRFQTVHHDVWDYDIPAQPVLFDMPVGGKLVPALAQATKIGHIFILDRRTGLPLSPVEERSVPPSQLPGEKLSPTQPFPKNPAFIVRNPDLTEDDMWGFTPYDKHACKVKFREVDTGGLFTPPSTRGWLQFPSFMGASNWGGITIDQRRGIMIANTTQVPMIPQADVPKLEAAGQFVLKIKDVPYSLQMEAMLSPFGAPCNRPPWGKLVAIDLKAQKVLWSVPLGTTRDQAPPPMWLKLGVPNMGGSIVTATGLVFIGATTDNYIRAYDIGTGKVLWRSRLPAGGQATPMTYRLRKNGRQFLVIAAGGHKYLGTGVGDSLVAYALPQ